MVKSLSMGRIIGIYTSVIFLYVIVKNWIYNYREEILRLTLNINGLQDDWEETGMIATSGKQYYGLKDGPKGAFERLEKAPESNQVFNPPLYKKPIMADIVLMVITLIVALPIHFTTGDDCTLVGLGYTSIILSYVVVFGAVFALITIRPETLAPFSNTFGYLIVKLMGIFSVFKEATNHGNTGDSITELYDLIADKPMLLINTLVPGSLHKLWKNAEEYNYDDDGRLSDPNSIPMAVHVADKGMRGGDAITGGKGDKAGNEIIDGKEIFVFSGRPTSLFKLLVLKDIISSGVWYFLAGCLAISLSTNVILDQKLCTPK